jgi:CDP-diacylglycerol--glycerol-3-phosphate 3-phosphatidyltransferase
MNTPTKITVTRIIAVVLMLISLFVLSVIPGFKTIEIANTGINLVYLIVFVLFVIACYTDHLDGYLARKNNQVTDLGKFLDPVADKLLINSLVIFLIAPSIFSPYIPESCGPVVGFNMWCAIILVARDIVVDALRFIGAAKGKVIAANIFGKLKTVLEMVAIGAVLLNDFPFRYFDKGWPVGLHISDILVYLATLASLISGIIYVIQNKHVFLEKSDKDERSNNQ